MTVRESTSYQDLFDGENTGLIIRAKSVSPGNLSQGIKQNLFSQNKFFFKAQHKPSTQ